MDGLHYKTKGPLVNDAPSTKAKVNIDYFVYVNKFKRIESPDLTQPYDIIQPIIQELFYKYFVEGHRSSEET